MAHLDDVVLSVPDPSLICSCVKGFSYGEDGGPEELLDVLDYQMEPRFFNFSIDSIFNDSLLTLGGIFIVGVILFGKVHIRN